MSSKMKAKARFILCIIASFIAPTSGFAGELWESAEQYIGSLEGAKRNPKRNEEPELEDRIKALVPENGVNMIKTWTISGKSSGPAKTIYIGTQDIEILAAPNEWNLSVAGMFVYEWKEGEKTGIRIKRNDGDLVAYLYYLTDPSWIMAGMYSDYLQNTAKGRIIKDGSTGIDEIVFEKPIEGFEALYLTKRPLWFLGFRATNDKGEVQFRVSKPIRVAEIPTSARIRREKIDFKDSEETLEQRMPFL